jgi:hypothetical protein
VLNSRKAPLKGSEDKDWSSLGPLSTAAAFQVRQSGKLISV